MEGGILGILGFVLGFVALDVVALRFGHDSRSMTREMPLFGDRALGVSPRSGHRPRALHRRGNNEDLAPRAQSVLVGASTHIARIHRSGKPVQPSIACEVYAFSRFDLAATGK